MPDFKAHVQYDDWKGSAAADDADFEALGGYLRNAGLLSDSEFLVGFKAYIGSPDINGDPYFSAAAFIVSAGNHEGSLQNILAKDPVEVFQRDVELGVLEFFNLFKRFNLVLTHRGFDLHGRNYKEIE
jgi:hypothetical protein